MASGLVYIGRVQTVSSIPDADRIEQALVVCGKGGRWAGIVQKGTLQPGDPCQVYLQDSIVPQTPDLAFMEKHKWRVKMCRFKGVPSECLIMPQSSPGAIGDDVTEAAGVTRFEKQLPGGISGENADNFPFSVPKTDEPNFQGVPDMVAALRGLPFYATVKADGTSCTVYHNAGHVGVCSRNWEKKDNGTNLFWRFAHQNGLPEKLPAFGNIAIQGEFVGPHIQKNRLGLPAHELLVFDVWFIDERRYAVPIEMRDIVAKLGLDAVDLISHGDIFDMDDEALRRFAEGKYASGHEREGVVIRPTENMAVMGERLSFKVINLNYRD